jgi:hypothetical protein
VPLVERPFNFIVERPTAGADDLVLELGAGTGEIGVHLVRLPIRHVGPDASPALLDLFRSSATLGKTRI